MANPWDNDPIIQAAPPPTATPWANDPIVTPATAKPADDGSWNLHDFITGKGGLIREGGSKVGQGVHELSQPGAPSKYQGAHDIISGLGSIAAPFAIGATLGAAPLAPVATASGLVAGTAGAVGGSALGHKLTEAAGGGPEAQQLGSDIGGLAGGALAGTYGVKGANALTEINSQRAGNVIYRPTPADTGFPEITQEAMADLKRYGGEMPQSNIGKASQAVGKVIGSKGYSRPIVEANNLKVNAPAIDKAISTVQAALDPYLDNARNLGVQIQGDHLVVATKNAIPDLMWTRDPQGAQALVDEAQRAFGGKQFTPDQFRDWLKTENGTLRSFYNRAAPIQGAAQQAGTPSAIEEAQADTIREQLYKAIDPENNGEGPRQIQKRTGNLYKLRDANERRANSISAEKPTSNLLGLANTAKTLKVLVGDPSAAAAGLHPFRGHSDALLTELYRQTPLGADLPTPTQVTPRALLGSAPIITPPPANMGGWDPETRTFTPSPIHVTTGPPITGPANRTLPPPTIKAPPVDFEATPPEAGTPPYPGRGISPDSGQRTLGEGPQSVSQATGEVTPRIPQNPTDLSGQAGDITDTIPQRNPVTGEVVHVPRPQKIPLARLMGQSIVKQKPIPPTEVPGSETVGTH